MIRKPSGYTMSIGRRHGWSCLWAMREKAVKSRHEGERFKSYFNVHSSGANMALNMSDSDIWYYNMDVVSSITLGHSYFRHLDDLVVKSWIHSIPQIWIEPLEYRYDKFSPGVISYFPDGLLCLHIVVVLQHLSLLVVAT